MKIKDPVCGKMIEKDGAAGTSPYKGKTYYFCSPSCLVEFEKDPMVYTGERSVGPFPKKDKAA